jgi:hypothetical protein
MAAFLGRILLETNRFDFGTFRYVWTGSTKTGKNSQYKVAGVETHEFRIALQR